jgi:hypothetical protein
MRLKIIFRSLLNHLIIRSRSGRFQKNELKRLILPTERLIGASLQHDPLNPLEISLRMTILIKMSVNSVITMKLKMKKLVYAGLKLVKIISIPWIRQLAAILR